VLWLIVWAAGPQAAAQAPPSLGLGFSGGQPTVRLTGAVGSVYSIQYATGLSRTNLWVDRTLLQAQGASNVWTEPSAASTGQRFYRAVSVAAPADTNLVFIQPGTFTMGSPTSEAERDSDEVQHHVTISRGFWMEKYLVTQGDYLAVVGSNPSYFTSANGFSDDLTRPVEQVNWYDAINYCGLRTQQERAGG
jgi:formylglycine-generating enzyme required for sulfatase activity